ncbi:hypothetical protein [uncultured Methylobacterium sp.]|jgi:CheY-like chemotaxis protein|uniref:hypothetical protein n=1 Tax=uncultured Methylobacterium sp. TaxID=157278 RepID=UPI0026366710|nr:hypothetical protein [uncultured Methylobacterium sp.]
MGQASPIHSTDLLVEDDRDVRNLAAAVLKETDLRVVEAETGENALDHLPSLAAFIPKPWRALDLLVAAKHAAEHLR